MCSWASNVSLTSIATGTSYPDNGAPPTYFTEIVNRDRDLVKDRDQARAVDAAKTAPDERKQAYVQLLVAARQLRYAARSGTSISLDGWRN